MRSHLSRAGPSSGAEDLLRLLEMEARLDVELRRAREAAAALVAAARRDAERREVVQEEELELAAQAVDARVEAERRRSEATIAAAAREHVERYQRISQGTVMRVAERLVATLLEEGA